MGFRRDEGGKIDNAMSPLSETMYSFRDDSQIAGLSRFFKTGPGQYGEGDQFLGIKVPVTRKVVGTMWKQTSLRDLEECISSPFHEIRLAALLTLVQMYKHSKKNGQQYVDFYLAHLQYINNWDLVDLSCYEILGRHLLNADRGLLYELARNGRTIWEQRIGIVSTMWFIRQGQLDDTYALVDIFLQKPSPLHDLLQKACGWLLREAGKHDTDRLYDYLLQHRAVMPRTMLRYAIEKFDEKRRQELMITKTDA